MTDMNQVVWLCFICRINRSSCIVCSFPFHVISFRLFIQFFLNLQFSEVRPRLRMGRYWWCYGTVWWHFREDTAPARYALPCSKKGSRLRLSHELVYTQMSHTGGSDGSPILVIFPVRLTWASCKSSWPSARRFVVLHAKWEFSTLMNTGAKNLYSPCGEVPPWQAIPLVQVHYFELEVSSVAHPFPQRITRFNNLQRDSFPSFCRSNVRDTAGATGGFWNPCYAF